MQTSSVPRVPDFEMTALPHTGVSSSSIINLQFKNLKSVETKIHVTKVSIHVPEVDAAGVFRDIKSFQIIVGGNRVGGNYRIDLDPMETRQYTVFVPTGVDADPTLQFKITARSNAGFECNVEGTSTGRDAGYVIAAAASPLVPKGDAAWALLQLGAIVRAKRYTGKFRITAEPGEPNSFGIFDKNLGNPMAAYIDIGRDGYRTLRGQHTAYLDWDRDTVAHPPDDLNAVHLTSLEPGSRHGWVFRTELIMTDEKGVPLTADSADHHPVAAAGAVLPAVSAPSSGSAKVSSSATEEAAVATRREEGGCACGAFRFYINISPRAEELDVSNCHCRLCQKFHSAPFVTWITVLRSQYHVTRGHAETYESSAYGRRSFCAKCGTQLFFSFTRHLEYVDVAVCALDRPADIRPKSDIWTDSMLPWISKDATLKSYHDGGDDWCVS
jgi:hypothetical protein